MKDVMQAELERLLRANGGDLLPPEAVVEAARRPESPLHDAFTWDDTEAAAKWRIEEARRLIRALVIYEPGEMKEYEVQPMFVSLRRDRASGGGYRLTTAVMRDEELRAQLLNDAKHDMESFRKKYQGLKELAHVLAAMEEVTAVAA